MRNEPAISHPITEFEVSDDGTLLLTGFTEAESRAELYDVADSWSTSPSELLDAMDECQPLAWAVHSIYSEVRDEIATRLLDAQTWPNEDKEMQANLQAQLDLLPEEPDDGVADWLKRLTNAEFADVVASEIEAWFGEPPDWSHESDYLPEECSAQGAAFAYFSSMAGDELESLGVVLVEGEHPGSTYYAAELTCGIDEANAAAESAGIAVRFVASQA